MNAVDLLLGMETGKLSEVPTREKKMKRLSELTGQPFIVKMKAIPGRKITELTAIAYNKKGEMDTGKAFDANVLVATEGMVEPNLKNKELQKHFGVATPKDLAEKLFLGGEIVDLADTVRSLSGYSEETDDDVKN